MNMENNQESVLGDYVLQLQKQKEEQERKRREQAAAEEARIRAEKEAEEAQKALIRKEKRRKKVFISILLYFAFLLVGGGVTYLVVISIQKIRIIQEAKSFIHKGDSCVSICEFDQAKKYYYDALAITKNKKTRQKAGQKLQEATEKQKAVNAEYEEALRRLRVLLEADDYKFNQYSNDCLNRMIELAPNRKETIYYKKLRK